MSGDEARPLRAEKERTRMLRNLSILGTLAGLLGGAQLGACSDDDAGSLLDAGFARDLDAGDGVTGLRDSGSARDARAASASPVLSSAEAAACASEPLTPFGASCTLADPGEPSSPRQPARLDLGSTCNVVRAWTADKEEDAYRFVVAHADPVRVELSYEPSARAELSAVVRADGARELARTLPSVATQSAVQSIVFQGAPGQSYDVELEGRLLGTCLPYALRVDERYCSDAFEDNDSEDSASKLPRPSDAVLEVEATASEGDMDFYQFITPLADPVLISGSYTATLDATVQLRRIVVNTAGLGSLDVAGARTGLGETFSHWLVSNSAGAVFRAQIWPTGTGCAAYTLRFDVAACTDAHEDNDLPEAAAALRFGETLQATSFRGDDDYYDVSASAAGGSCTASYTLADGSTQLLRLTVFNGGSMIAASVPPGVGSSQKTVSVAWPRAATVLSIAASRAGECQPYTLRCEQTPAPAVQ